MGIIKMHLAVIRLPVANRTFFFISPTTGRTICL